jgi:hypothetical protein
MTTYTSFNHAAAWRENAEHWSTYGPPVRPSPAELLLYNLAIQTQAKEPFATKALVLGDCPEVRDLLATHQCVTHVVAHDPNAVIAMNRLLTYQGMRKEKMHVDDWQYMDLGEKSFDLIMSDGGLNSLDSWPQYSRTLARAAAHLKPTGLMVLRLNVHIQSRPRRTVKEIMADYRVDAGHKFSYLLELEMYSDIATYNPETYRINLGEFYRERVMESYHPFFDVTMTYPEQHAFERLLSKYVSIESVRYGRDYPFSSHEPIYFCRALGTRYM